MWHMAPGDRISISKRISERIRNKWMDGTVDLHEMKVHKIIEKNGHRRIQAPQEVAQLTLSHHDELLSLARIV